MIVKWDVKNAHFTIIQDILIKHTYIVKSTLSKSII